MSASAIRRTRRDINFVILRDGRGIHLDAIATVDEGQAALDDLDCAVLSIEAQLAADGGGANRAGWRCAAEATLRKKRRIRPRLQQRIAELRRIERRAAPSLGDGSGKLRRENRRKAFIDAAEELLPAETFTEIWARAAEREPELFGGLPA